MGDFHSRRAKFFKSQSQPFPGVLACLGNYIGQFNHKTWWHAKGKARDMFKLIQKDIAKQLQSAFMDTCTSIVHFHLFMIGSCEESAKPVIMFFCQEKKPRKKAQKIIEEGGILEKLPGFRTGHQAQQPDLGQLILPATISSSSHIWESPILHTDVYFDSSSDIQTLGMPIFSKNKDGSWRRANAYLVSQADRYVLMSVSHIFFEAATSECDTTIDDDSDFDLGSDYKSEAESEAESEEQIEISIEANLSDAELGHDERHQDGTLQLTVPTITEPVQVTRESFTNYQPNTPELLGNLLQSSIDEDWATIGITNDICASFFLDAWSRDELILAESRVVQEPKNSRGFLYNVSTTERMGGTLSEDTTYMRLPGSFTSQELFMVTLDGVINWGDCGSVFLDAETMDLYGHLVASSENLGVAFIMPAVRIFKSAKMKWDTALFTSKSTPEIKLSVDSALREGPPAFVFRIDEFTEHPDAPERCDQYGKFIPSDVPGYNIRQSGGASGQWWLCEKDNKVQRLASPNPPVGSSLYKTFSTIYSDGHGFHVLRGDAINPPAGEAWQHLWFEWNERTLSSALTNAGTARALRVQDPSAWWPHMLLPDIYHGPTYTAAGYGGLTGELAIFLALVALSMKPERLLTELPRLTEKGEWVTHGCAHGRIDKRGVIVYVYALNNNEEELRALENGDFGNYYD